MAIDRDTPTQVFRLSRATTFFSRLLGLIGRTQIGTDQAFLIEHCRAIHTLGMHMPIDVIFISEDGTVLKAVEWVRPGRFVLCPGAVHVVEFAGGVLAQLRLGKGIRAQVGRANLSFTYA